MIVNVSYKVRKPFKYNGKVQKIGSVWIPDGSKGDDMIKRSTLVVRFESAVNDPDTGKVRMGITIEADKLPETPVGVKAEPEKVVKRKGRKPRAEVKPVTPKDK